MPSQNTIYRTAPAVDDLSDIKNLLKNLEFAPVPFLWLDNFQKIIQNLRDTPEIINDLSAWTKRNGFGTFKGYFSELVYLLRTLHIIQDRKMLQQDRENFLGDGGPSLLSLNPPKNAKVQELTFLGNELCNIIASDNHELFRITLFWIFLTHKRYIQDTNLKPLMPVWQIMLSRAASASNSDIKDMLRRLVADTYTINAFKKWSEFFNLCTIAQDNPTILYLDRRKLSLKIFQAVIIELNHNFMSGQGHNVDDIIRMLGENFSLSPSEISYRNMLRTIFSSTSRDVTEGTYTGRGEKPLFEDKRINKIKFHSRIPISNFQRIDDSILDLFLEVD